MGEKITIKLDDINVRDFYGAQSENITYIKRKYPQLTFTVRGERVVVSGEEQPLYEFEGKMARLIAYFKRYGHISESVINQMFDTIKMSPSSTVVESGGDRDKEHILFGKSGTAIKVRSENQLRMVEAIEKSDLLFAIGPAGSGKTYVAIALAVRALKERKVKRIILTRPAVEAGEKLGYLPGDMKEKLDPYLQPLYDALDDMLPAKRLELLIEEKIIQIAPLAYMRGRTLDNAFVILDEAQNTTKAQLKMFLTRMGKNAKFIVTGDISQIDLPSTALSGLKETMGYLKEIEGVSFVTMDREDIVRHRLVKDIVDAFDANTLR